MSSSDPAVRQFVEGRADGPLTSEAERAGQRAISEAR